jgi:hypothetical protein
MNASLITVGGMYCIAFAVFHLLFWRIFNWSEDLRSLSFLNRAIMQVLNLSLTIVFILFAYVSLVHTNELLTTPLGNSLLIFISLLWFARAAMQPIFFKFKHWGSIAFFLLFLLGGVLYGLPAL